MRYIVSSRAELSLAAGQRCMAISVAVLVGSAQEWLPDLIKLAQNLKVSGGFEQGADLYAFHHSSSCL